MQEDDLEELRKGFIEAIAAHKFVELKLGTDRTAEINKLKRRWARIKEISTLIPDLDTEQNIISYKYEGIGLQLLKIKRELESTKIQIIEQQRITNNLLKQNSLHLQQIQELINSLNIPHTLAVTNLEYIDGSDLESLKRMLDEF